MGEGDLFFAVGRGGWSGQNREICGAVAINFLKMTILIIYFFLMIGGNNQQSPAPNTQGINNAVAETLPMLQAAPNPTKDATIFTYQLLDNLEVGTIEIRSMQGQLMEIIQLSANTGSINWTAGKLANGVYLYSLIVNNKIIANQRLVITK
jgi:hypothetical protein